MVAAEPGVQYPLLLYKPLEREKEICLRKMKEDFNKFMHIPAHLKPLLSWWVKKLPTNWKLISHGQPQVILYSDASKKGWGQ